jgi:hypothetical protein
MKNYIYLLGLLFVFTSCNESVKTAGFSNLDVWQKGITIGNQADVDTWLKYVELHNQRDLDGIKALNSENIQIYDAWGGLTEGSEAHIEFLKNWFEASDPKFKAIWGTAVTEVGYKTGSMVKSVYEMSYKQGDSTVYVNQNYDTWIENGKVMAFWVNHRLLTENEVKALKNNPSN